MQCKTGSGLKMANTSRARTVGSSRRRATRGRDGAESPGALGSFDVEGPVPSAIPFETTDRFHCSRSRHRTSQRRSAHIVGKRGSRADHPMTVRSSRQTVIIIYYICLACIPPPAHPPLLHITHSRPSYPFPTRNSGTPFTHPSRPLVGHNFRRMRHRGRQAQYKYVRHRPLILCGG